ncbi:hydroxyphenylacetyl-CoA thioesterase PaaI [Kineosporia sp. NBRC 101731]|uniref:hydroxyphenylacetyl-CoA thioesterase PaaI n=1 Tax=Kineosporia sp. NBRC 101731 TaxID=3032199 RepID=UPI0024A070FB|nr:hydroxyphenylacetyl-CoA thioesterase PaaI [Kineosporia sp. NBRC 101731]GLY33263.1 phenylacetic acid degradation protein PaaD [Kineosporia sp. NBRC 101731]
MITEEDVALAARSVAAMLAGDRASAALGMRLESVAPGRAVMSMLVRPDMTNGYQICHGGLIAAVADTAFAAACNTYGDVTVAAGFDITFLESARLGDDLEARAEERARRGRSGVYDVTVVRRATAAEPEAVIAEFRGRSRSLGKPISGP